MTILKHPAKIPERALSILISSNCLNSTRPSLTSVQREREREREREGERERGRERGREGGREGGRERERARARERASEREKASH